MSWLSFACGFCSTSSRAQAPQCLRTCNLQLLAFPKLICPTALALSAFIRACIARDSLRRARARRCVHARRSLRTNASAVCASIVHVSRFAAGSAQETTPEDCSHEEFAVQMSATILTISRQTNNTQERQESNQLQRSFAKSGLKRQPSRPISQRT